MYLLSPSVQLYGLYIIDTFIKWVMLLKTIYAGSLINIATNKCELTKTLNICALYYPFPLRYIISFSHDR